MPDLLLDLPTRVTAEIDTAELDRFNERVRRCYDQIPSLHGSVPFPNIIDGVLTQGRMRLVTSR